METIVLRGLPVPGPLLDTFPKVKLGIVPSDLQGSAMVSALTSFGLFNFGAAISLLLHIALNWAGQRVYSDQYQFAGFWGRRRVPNWSGTLAFLTAAIGDWQRRSRGELCNRKPERSGYRLTDITREEFIIWK